MKLRKKRNLKRIRRRKSKMEEQRTYRLTYKSVGRVRGCIVGRFNEDDLNRRAEELRREIREEVNIKATEIAWHGALVYKTQPINI